jgi:CheY-like chemotaxis protein
MIVSGVACSASDMNSDPRNSSHTEQALAPREAAANNRPRVLVVDDNRDGAESLGMLLEMDGCEVSLAFGGQQALHSFETFQPHIALLDIGMPGMDGYELARRIRQNARGSSVLLVALTGWGQADDKKRAADAGFDEHLTKPVDPDLLGRLITLGRSVAA